MGLLGCLASFQRLAELGMSGMINIMVYIDDLLVHSKTHEEHLDQLDKLFCRLRAVNLKARLPKCKFGEKNVQYLGFRLTPEGILPGVDKLKAVKDTEVPQSIKEVRQIHWIMQFFQISHQINNLLYSYI